MTLLLRMDRETLIAIRKEDRSRTHSEDHQHFAVFDLLNGKMSVSNQVACHPTEELPLAALLALDRTRIAYERTLMAWIRTGTSLITFGFAVYKFFQLEIAGTALKPGLIATTIIGPREFGLALIGIGLLSLLIGTIEHRRDLRALSKDYPSMPFSGSLLIAVSMGALGLLAFVGVVYRF